MTKKKDIAIQGGLKEMELLFSVSQMLDQSLDLRVVSTPVLEAIARHLKLVHGTLTLLNRKTGELYIEAAYGLSRKQMERGRYKLGEGVTGKVVKTGKPVIIPKISEEPEFLDKTGARKNKKDVTFMCVPIKAGNEVIGALSADQPYSDEAQAKENMRTLTVVASMIAQAVKIRLVAEEEKERLVEENKRLRRELTDKFQPSNIIGKSHVMTAVYDQIAQVSKSNASVLILGESGTGKELVASAIHYNSLRLKKPFIKINCAALPEGVLESELFGHEVGAFTGAQKERKGRFELAHGGTIFLDEIGDIPIMTQIKLLRVLQEKEFERVGGTNTVKVDVRLIAATNRNLEEMIRVSEFREDLYYRLNVFPIRIPPLRERKTDILLLANHFVEKYSTSNHKNVRRISTPAIDMLMSYHWPGNVRELENCIERAVLVSNDDVIHGHHLPPTLQTAEASGTSHTGTLQESLDNLERELLLDALKTSRGNKAKAARALGITERLMGIRVDKHGIDPKRFRTIQ